MKLLNSGLLALALVSSSLALASGFSQYKCEEMNPTGEYKVLIYVMEDAFGKMRASVYHQNLSNGRRGLTTALGGCESTSATLLSCREGTRTFELFNDMSAQYAGIGQPRNLSCSEVFRSRD